MKFLTFIFVLISSAVFAQSLVDTTPVYYNFNGTPAHGIKIKTQIPFQNGKTMPTLILEGYQYGSKKSIGLMINFYIYGGAFRSHSISSHGTFTPEVKLANENGLVVVFINARGYYTRFQLRAYGKGMGNDIPINYEGWTTAHEPLTGTNVVTLQYKSKSWEMKTGDTFYHLGKVGVGTSTVGAKLHVSNGSSGKNPHALTDLAVEDDEDGMISILTPRNKRGFYAFADSDDQYVGGMVYEHATDRLVFRVNNHNSDMVIDKNGNVGIATTNTRVFRPLSSCRR